MSICTNLSIHKIKEKNMMNKAYSFLDRIIHNNLCLAKFILAYKLEPETQNKYFTYTILATSAFVAPLSQYNIPHISCAKGELI